MNKEKIEEIYNALNNKEKIEEIYNALNNRRSLSVKIAEDAEEFGDRQAYSYQCGNVAGIDYAMYLLKAMQHEARLEKKIANGEA